MATKKEYINLIRWSCLIDSFTNHYFIRVIVLYLLSKSVTPWVAVSIPIVLEFARLISRGFTPLVKFALKVDYKKYHIFHLVAFLVLGLAISQSRSVYIIYLFTLISGVLSGIKYSSITKLNTSNKEYEPYCFIEEERSQVSGGALGLIASQLVYDQSPTLYVIGYFVLIVLGTIFSLLLKNVPADDVMTSVEDGEILEPKEKKNTIIVTLLYGILVGFWCMAWGGFTEITPLITNKVGYLHALHTIIEFVLLCIISGKTIQKIKSKKKLLFAETIIAYVDVICLLIAALTLSWQGVLIAYIITSFTSTLGDPIWGSIISAYSTNNRKKYVLVNRVYFIVRATFSILTWWVCRECVIRGIESFRYLSVILIALITVMYIIANKVNKNVFGDRI